MWEIDAIEEGRQARRAEEQAQRDQQPTAPILNRGKRRRKTKFHLTSAYVPQNLDDAILNLCWCQLAQQNQLLDHLQITRVKTERQRQVEERQLQ